MNLTLRNAADQVEILRKSHSNIICVETFKHRAAAERLETDNSDQCCLLLKSASANLTD